MSSAVVMERSVVASPIGGLPANLPGPTAAPAGWCTIPRCRFKFEKCAGGLKVHCCCDDEVAAATLQNLCRMLADGMCSCSCTWNGLTVCQCNLAMGLCKCEPTKDGVCITCTSGDKKCCDILQAFCDCLKCCCDAGCCCCICFSNTPVCCGSC